MTKDVVDKDTELATGVKITLAFIFFFSRDIFL